MRRLAIAAALFAVAAAPARYVLPDERPAELPAGAGRDLAQAHCAACHSLDYLTTQPPGMGRAFWADEVTKMVDRYGADISEADRRTIAAYLGEMLG